MSNYRATDPRTVILNGMYGGDGMNDSWPMKPKKKEEPVMMHGGLRYKCSKCGEGWTMWLENGVEDHGKYGRPHQPCPIVIKCDCNGMAQHVDWHADITLSNPVPIKDGMRYFAYDSSGKEDACGIPRRREND